MCFFNDLKHFKWSWRALLLFEVCPVSLRRPLHTASSVLSLCKEDTHGNCDSKLGCACFLCFGSQWIRGIVEHPIVEHGITVCMPWRNIFALLMHIYILQTELLALLAVDIHVSRWGYHTWKTPNKKATLLLWNLLICSVSFGVLVCKSGGVGHWNNVLEPKHKLVVLFHRKCLSRTFSFLGIDQMLLLCRSL